MTALMVKAADLPDELPDIERRAKAIGKGSPLSLRERALVEGIADGVKDHIKALEVRIDELQKTQLRFCGRWTEGEYEPNSIVELGGSAWVAKRLTRSKPAPDSVEADWSLAVRRGRDGKDAK